MLTTLSMKNTFLLLSTACVLIVVSCRKITASAAGENCSFPQGLYVNTTFLSECDHENYTEVPFTFLEMNFKENQTVTLDNGVEKYTIPVIPTEQGCRFIISNPSLFGELNLVLVSDSQIQLFDTAMTSLSQPSLFERRTDSADEAVSFDFRMNDCVLAGDFLLYKKGVQQSGFVTIMPNGQLNGLKPYLGYELCFTRDCVANQLNTVYLISQSGQKEAFHFKKTDGKNFIAFYPAGSQPDESSQATGGSQVAFELRLR
jgi:hypothetical protein